MAVSIRIDAIRRQGGKVFIRTGKVEREYSLADLRGMEQDVKERLPELAIGLFLHRLRAINPAMDNPDLLIGRTLTIDPTIANIVRLT